MQKTYDVDYFIKKFEATKEEAWITGQYADNHHRFCALGHCGTRDCGPNKGETAEALALVKLAESISGGVPWINDGQDERFPQPTPRLRILAALRYIKEKTCPSSS